MNTFTHTIYSKIISWYLLINGLLGLGLAFMVVNQGVYSGNKTIFGINAILLPCLSALLGYYLLIKENWAFKLLPKYLILSTPIVGIGSWLYSHAHALSLNFNISVMGVVVGLNFLPILWLVLFNKHVNLTSNSCGTAATRQPHN